MKSLKKLKKIVDSIMTETRPTSEVVEEIHASFFTEVDRLLAEAKISSSMATDKQSLIDKCNRLRSLGFTQTKEMQDAAAEIERIENARKENEKKQELINAIEFFSVTYPAYKFITEDSVNKICKKYGLVYGEISRYKGTVPEKNLKHIEEFKVLEDHECYLEINAWRGMMVDHRRFKYITREQYDRSIEMERKMPSMIAHNIVTEYAKAPLEIAAPVSDFDMTDMEIKGNKLQKIHIPDPVVLKPVIFNGTKYYLIVTAWGDEASDEMVVNQQMN